MASGPSKARNVVPAFISGTAQTATYDGASDDLLTGGLGKSGLAGAAPTFANPAAPTAAELRRAAIYNNYRALIDPTAAGGFGVLYGPNIDASGADTLGEGKIAGDETIAYVDGVLREHDSAARHCGRSFCASVRGPAVDSSRAGYARLCRWGHYR